jgi:mevalonate kinase
VNTKTFYSNGKLLISGEYVVLDGALSLAIPTKYGQSLTIDPIDEPILIWESFDNQGTVWFQGTFNLSHSQIQQNQHDETSSRLIQIFNAAKTLNPDFLNTNKGYRITTKLDFPTNWGLGTSSTLINNMAQWANINPYQLLANTFGGSGYDIACAKHDTPITYQIKNNQPIVHAVNFNPSFKNHLFFVHLNKKQNSREGIKHYRKNKDNSKSRIKEIDAITLKMINSTTLEHFESSIQKHESIISKITNQATIQKTIFNDFTGSIKSLGAWGGDFVLVASKLNPTNYFEKKGYHVIIPYNDMLL